MKVVSVGGGPAGLYLSLLLAKQDPSHEITVYERYAPDETFGWGVVFSDATLSRLREADLTSYTRITDSFVRWSAIDVWYRGELLRSDGHVFAAIKRVHLLRILQERCAELGVRLEFNTEVDDTERFVDADLVLGTDGVNSRVRDRHAAAFRPTLDERHARYIWYGSPLLLDAFTFIFVDSPHGLFQAHAYPFDGTTSTFIVETTEQTWRSAGLADADEAHSIAFCEQLFADYLKGAPLLSNRSRWVHFVTVSNRSWSHGNVVLLGDAAHTAHFSIGSGTKLAMEDAIALAQAVERSPDDLPAAVSVYEKERRPVIERFQEAAQDSLTYFENVARYTHFEPLQFAFYLLTRSGRITYDNLRLRDPWFLADVDRWFAGHQEARRLVVSPPALTTLQLRGRELANRVVAAPVSAAVGDDGLASGGHLEELRAAVATGAGLVMTPTLAVRGDGRVTPHDAGLYRDDHKEPWTEAVAAIHRQTSTLVGVTLGHAGRRGSTRPRSEGVDLPLPHGGWPLVAASAIPYTPGHRMPAALDRDGLQALREAFVRAAERAAQIGFDLLEVDAADGYLLSSFISPLTNRRCDEYGEDRLRFPLEVVEGVRGVWPDDRPLAVRLCATDWAEGGTTVDDAVVFARALAQRGVDLIQVRAGQTTAASRPRYGRGFLVPYSDEIRNEACVATLVGGGLLTLGDCNTVLAAGRADVCVLDDCPRPGRR